MSKEFYVLFEQAEKCLLEIEEIFQNLILNPQLGKKRDEIKKDLYSFPKDNYVIFYKILNKSIRIVRVLHGSRDVPKYF